MQGSETCSRESHISCRACFSHSSQLKNGMCWLWRSVCLGSYQSRGSFWWPMRLLDVPPCPSHGLLQQDSRTVGLLLLREIKTCAYIYSFSQQPIPAIVVLSILFVLWPQLVFHAAVAVRQGVQRPSIIWNCPILISYICCLSSAHICLKFLSFHIIHVDKFGLWLYFTCHYAVHSWLKLISLRRTL